MSNTKRYMQNQWLWRSPRTYFGFIKNFKKINMIGSCKHYTDELCKFRCVGKLKFHIVFRGKKHLRKI